MQQKRTMKYFSFSCMLLQHSITADDANCQNKNKVRLHLDNVLNTLTIIIMYGLLYFILTVKLLKKVFFLDGKKRNSLDHRGF